MSDNISRDWSGFEASQMAYRDRCRHIAKAIVSKAIEQCSIFEGRGEAEEIEMLTACSYYDDLLSLASEQARGNSDYRSLKEKHNVREDFWRGREFLISEGWCYSDNSDYGLQIEVYDEDRLDRFDCDNDAQSYVAWKASRGSDLHASILKEIALSK